MNKTDCISVRLRHLVSTADGGKVLDVDAEFKRGAIISIAGYKNSGKSELLKMIAGICAPQEGVLQAFGEVWFDSVNNINVRADKRGISYMFQDLALFDNMSIKDNLTFAQKKKDEARVEALLELFGLGDLAACKTAKVMGALRRRIALARALAQESRLLVLDDPMHGLDDDARAEMRGYICKAHKFLGGTTIIGVENGHDAKDIADFTYKVENGSVVKSVGCGCSCKC